MKYFVAIFLFAFVAGIYAEDYDDMLLEDEVDGGDPDRHPYIQCKIDLYDCVRLDNVGNVECLKRYKTCMAQLIPTIPPFVTACKNELKQCVSSASGFVAKGKCFIAFAKCLKNKGPSGGAVLDMGQMNDDAMEPDRHPYVQCKIDLYDCVRLGKEGKLQCFKNYKTCMAQLLPTVPPYVIACKADLKQCLDSSSAVLAKAKCFKDFGLCLVNGPTKPPALDAIEDAGQMEYFNHNGFLQCNKDLYNCFKDGKYNRGCLKDYRACIVALIPPYVKQCHAKAKECFENGGGNQCAKELGICLKNGAPTQAPPQPSAP